jgi:hypothetical protein
MSRIRAAALAALCASLFACAPPPPPPPPAPKGPPVDGFYRGTSTRFQAQSRACPHPGLALIQVYDNKFTTRWDRTTDVNATIGGDGTIQGGAENISLTGKLDGTKMTFDVTNGDCGLHFTVTQLP